jgi:hypothetical protein
MKKLVSMMLGLALIVGTAVLTYGDDASARNNDNGKLIRHRACIKNNSNNQVNMGKDGKCPKGSHLEVWYTKSGPRKTGK